MRLFQPLSGFVATFAFAVAASGVAVAQDAPTYGDFLGSSNKDDRFTEDQKRNSEQKRDFDLDVKRGAEALKAGDYAAADGYFNSALALDPDNAGVCYLMAMTKIGRGAKSEAVGYLDRAIASDANYVEARLLLAKLLVMGGDVAGARQQLEALKAMQGACSGRCTEAQRAAAVAQIEQILG